MNIGRYIFSQVMDYIPRYQFDKLVAKYRSNWHAKDLSCYNQLLHLLFGHITGCGSLRDIVCVLTRISLYSTILASVTLSSSPLFPVPTRIGSIGFMRNSECILSVLSDRYTQIPPYRISLWIMSFMLLTPQPYPPVSSWQRGHWANTAREP